MKLIRNKKELKEYLDGSGRCYDFLDTLDPVDLLETDFDYPILLYPMSGSSYDGLYMVLDKNDIEELARAIDLVKGRMMFGLGEKNENL